MRLVVLVKNPIGKKRTAKPNVYLFLYQFVLRVPLIIIMCCFVCTLNAHVSRHYLLSDCLMLYLLHHTISKRNISSPQHAS